MDDKELFEAATASEPVEQVEETPVEQPRDEHGRFAPKAQAEEQVEPVTQEQPVTEQPVTERPDEAHVPPWRLRELREERDALRQQLEQTRSEMQRQFAELRASQPKPEPTQKPDLYENPDGFVEHGVRQHVDPVRSEIGQLREFYSRKEAIREHGQDKVQAAYDALGKGMQSRDPDAIATYQRAMSSMDPYGDIVTWHQQKTVYSQIGSDPNAWFEKQIAERLKDQAFQAKLLQQIQGSQQSNPSKQNVINLPKSLNKATGSSVSEDDLDDNDMSDRALFRHAAAPRR